MVADVVVGLRCMLSIAVVVKSVFLKIEGQTTPPSIIFPTAASHERAHISSTLSYGSLGPLS